MSRFGKYFLLAAGFAFLATFAHFPGAITKVHAKDQVCSLASLKGTYAYVRSGVNKSLGGPVAEIGIDVFNGDGTRGIIRATGSSLDGSYDWTDSSWPNGSYTVDPDCTGSFFAADGTKANNIIVLDGGKRFSVLSAPLETGKVVTGEGTRLDVKDKD
jgi:hypothetical protein